MLITLVIIGVIAALTIPNLMQKYTEQTTVKKVQKFYSNLSNAYNLAMKENGPIIEWNLTGNNQESALKIYETLFKPYFKVAKNCGFDNKGNCVAETTYKFLNNNLNVSYGKKSPTFYKIALDDGSVIFFTALISDSNTNLLIYYDINGIKEPNQWGKDAFEFRVENIVVPSGIQTGAHSYRPFNQLCINKTSDLPVGLGCTAWVIYKGNMDYLHCDLTWDKHSCKDK